MKKERTLRKAEFLEAPFSESSTDYDSLSLLVYEAKGNEELAEEDENEENEEEAEEDET